MSPWVSSCSIPSHPSWRSSAVRIGAVPAAKNDEVPLTACDLGKRLTPIEPGLDRVLAVEEIRNAAVGTRQLAQHIRGVATTGRAVAEPLKTVDRALEPVFDDVIVEGSYFAEILAAERPQGR